MNGLMVIVLRWKILILAGLPCFALSQALPQAASGLEMGEDIFRSDNFTLSYETVTTPQTSPTTTAARSPTIETTTRTRTSSTPSERFELTYSFLSTGRFLSLESFFSLDRVLTEPEAGPTIESAPPLLETVGTTETPVAPPPTEVVETEVPFSPERLGFDITTEISPVSSNGTEASLSLTFSEEGTADLSDESRSSPAGTIAATDCTDDCAEGGEDVPEPGGALIVGLGLIGLMAVARKRKTGQFQASV